MNDQDAQPGPNVAGHVTRTNADGSVSTTDFIVDTETGQQVVTGDAPSQDVTDFMGLLSGIASMIEADDDA